VNRRGFLAMLAGASLDPERLLWKPGKLISIPKPSPIELYPNISELDSILIQTTYRVQKMGFGFVDMEIWPKPPDHLRARIVEHARKQASRMYPIWDLRLRTDDMKPGDYTVYPWEGWPKR
jgi:hypothetical protein